MINRKVIKIGKKRIEGLCMSLSGKNLVVLRGDKGFVMCGYLNIRAANKFKDVAAKVTGVSTIGDALNSTVRSCSLAAKRAGIYPGQPIKETLKIIA